MVENDLHLIVAMAGARDMRVLRRIEIVKHLKYLWCESARS
jgi:hypothetical protein